MAAALEAGLPPELARRLAARYGIELADDIVAGYAARRATTLRANALKATPAQVAAALDEQGIDWRTPEFFPHAFVLDSAREDAVRALALYEEGGLYLQSLSAMLPPLALDPHPGENILDMAAAPGGKTCQIAALSSGKALITACEKNAVRAQKLRYNLEKQGVRNVSVMECDARKLDSFFTFDKVLLDAPCSGSGTVSLADGTYHGGFTDELLARSISTQRALLHRALSAVRPGGLVAYATCSILPEENDELIMSVLDPSRAASIAAQQSDARKSQRGKHGKRGRGRKGSPGGNVAFEPFRGRAEVVPLPQKLLEGVPLLPCALEGAACVKPTDTFEGFFIALLKRVS